MELLVQVSQKFINVFQARCITARRLAFSRAGELAQARNGETKRYSRAIARHTD